MLWSTGISAAGAEAAVSQISVLPSELYATGLRDAFRDTLPSHRPLCVCMSVFRDLLGAADGTGGSGYADRPPPACWPLTKVPMMPWAWPDVRQCR
jgi:hypothetical protein